MPSERKPSSSVQPRNTSRRWSREELANQILKGDLLTIYQFKVLRLNSWLTSHPGGELALLHFVGRDATDEIEAYHSEKTLKERIPRFCVGELDEMERKTFTSLVPPIMLGFTLQKTPSGDTSWVPLPGPITALAEARTRQGSTAPLSVLQLEDLFPPPGPKSLSPPAVQKAHAEAYRRLHAKIKDAGLYTAPPVLAGYLSDTLRYCFLGGVFIALWWMATSEEIVGSAKRWALLLGSAVSLGLFWDQLTFLAHDAGHTSVIGGDYWRNRVFGMLIADWIGGLSLGWWVDNHNVHHLVTNHPEHDPDIQHIPFFAISPKFFESIFSTYYNHVKYFDAFSKFMVAHQHRTYYVVLALARFNLYVNSYTYLAKQSRRRGGFWWFEIAGITTFWAWFGVGVLGGLSGWKERLVYLLVSHVCASPVHVQIVLSHFSRSTEDLGVLESFAHRQLRTTMDVTCSETIEFIHGGLDKQVTHHLFPRIPRHNLRAASLLVKEFCKEQDLEFAEWGWLEGNRQVLGVLREVADQIEFIGMVARAEAVEHTRKTL